MTINFKQWLFKEDGGISGVPGTSFSPQPTPTTACDSCKIKFKSPTPSTTCPSCLAKYSGNSGQSGGPSGKSANNAFSTIGGMPMSATTNMPAGMPMGGKNDKNIGSIPVK